MATIRTAIQMVDGMSPVIRGMTNALNICMSSFESMQRVSGNAMDTSSIEAYRREISSAEASFNQVESSIRNSNSQQQQFNNSVREGQTHAEGLANKIGNVVKAYLGFQAVKGVADASDSYVLTQARLGLMNDGLQTTAQLNDKIFQSAERSRSSYTETAKSVAKLGILAGDAFSSSDETVAFAEQMNKQFKIGGASIDEQKNGMYQLTQAMAAGKLQGDEFRSISENAPLLSKAIAEFTGKSMGELKEMSSEGQITASIIKQSLFAAADEANAKFEALPKTIADVGTKIQNNAMKIFAPILTRINEIVNYNFDSIVANILGVMRVISGIATNIINVGVSIGTFFQNNWGLIEPIIWGVIAALIVYNAVLGIGWLTTLGSSIALAAKTVVSWAETAALIAMTYAQYGFNAALAMCPITWIIVAIIAVIAVLYMWVAHMNKVQGTTTSATGIIAGTFVALGATMYNIFAFMWNVIAAFVEFFANVFKNPTESVKRLFINFGLAVIDAMIGATRGCDQFATNMANAIIGGINNAIDAWNSFVDMLSTFGIADKLGLSKGTNLSYTTSITSDLDSAKADLQAQLANTSSDYISIPRMESKDIGAAFNGGYKWGYDASNMFDNLKLPGEDGKDPTNYDDLLKNAENIAGNTGDTAGNTGAIKDSLDISDEDLKYLRDIAEQEVINRFTTAEVKVDMTNHNAINSDVDLDGIINSLGEGVYEGLQTVAEGATYDV